MNTLDVIIPAWNAERYLGAAIASVLEQSVSVDEQQSALTIDVVVVDDGSTDRTAELARSLGARVIHQANAGPAAARNRGLAAGTSALVAFLDADDRWAPGRLVHQLAALAADPDALVLGLVEEEVSAELDAERAAQLRPKPGRMPGYLAGALVCRRATFDRVGPFDEALRVGETVAWFQRARTLGLREVVVPELVLVRRLHGDNLTLRTPTRAADYVAMARALLAQKRGS